MGEILGAELTPSGDQPLKLKADLGEERRHAVTALAQSYTPGELHGMKVVVVANVAPVRIKGIESRGMLLGVGCDEVKSVALLTTSRPMPNGASVL